MSAVGVVGAGAVGQAVCGALVMSGLCGRLLLTSRMSEQTAALAADLDDMRVGLGSPVRPLTCHPTDLMDCEAVVVTLRTGFVNTCRTDIRMGGAAANASAVRALGAGLRGYSGTVLVVTNPVDLMARAFAEVSGCRRVFGIGSNLDSVRYRGALARLLNVTPRAVRGHVIGEHGDGAVVCASSTTVNAQPVPIPLQQVRDELATRPGRIRAGIGRTRSGPAGAVASALRLTLGLSDGVTELSAPWQGGWIGIPLRFTHGRPVACLPALDDSEQRQFAAAHHKLVTAYRALHGHATEAIAVPAQERTP
ncbi:lactate dehydrogenase [Streptomyces sp. SAJ15]|nr:lactate dehydrogenase [Streptomyces sp. SAJ15]